VTGAQAAVAAETPVLIVGGGPVGLALALDLGYRGVRSMLAERDPGTATVLLAKANGLHERTMEMCRRWGIAARIAEVGFPADHPGDTVYATALFGHFIGRTEIPATRDRPTPDTTPEKRQRCPQYEFDPLLARAVQERGHTDLRYGHAFDRLEQDRDGVTATLRDESGRPVRVRARYLVGCDGAGSDVRRQLGVPFEGTLLDYSVSAMIRIPEMEIPAPTSGGERYILISPDGAWCVFTSVDGRTMWRITLVGSKERVNPDDIDVPAAIRRAIGRDDVPFEVLRTVPWRRSQCSAATYRQGRVLLAGDAAHTTSPTGGHGLNTGIGDVNDLGWMLAALVGGWGGDGLLAAYDLERRPVAIRNARSSTANYQGWVDNDGYQDVLRGDGAGEECRRRIGDRLASSLHQEWNSLGIDLGYRYEESPIIVPDGTPSTPDDPSDYVPTSRPGHRAPHAWLADGRSTLDLFGPDFTLLRLGEPDVNVSALLAAARERGLPLGLADIDEPAVVKLYQRRLVLVRPDGHVAWRADAPPADPSALVDTVRGAR
jgi:2-polyprenyl-6-methoxyphenol hydroxylase-like FAD-dependent oxidoreductase